MVLIEMCKFCHVDGFNPHAVQHRTEECQDSRNHYKYGPPQREYNSNSYEGRVTRLLRQQLERPPLPVGGVVLTPVGPMVIGPVAPIAPLGVVPIAMSPGNVTFMPVFYR